VIGLFALVYAVVIRVEWSGVNDLIAAGRVASQTQTLIVEVETAVSRLKDAETGQRGYLLTQNTAYLAPYTAAIPEVRAHLRLISPLVVDPQNRETLTRLDGLVEEKLQELQQTIDLYDRGEREAALAIVASNRGKRIMDDIRAAEDRMQGIAQSKLDRAVERSNRSVRLSRLALILGSGLTYALLIVVAFVIYRHLRARTLSEEQGERLYQEAQRALRTRDAFLSVAGHEFRTPLSALSLTIENLREQAKIAGDEALEARLQSPARQVDRLGRLTEQLLDVGRIDSGRLALEPEEVELVGLTCEVLDRLGTEAKAARCELRLQGPAPVRGRWDRSRLDQVITNLVTNALKFGGGSPVEVSVTSTGDSATLAVRDRGIGIRAEDQGRIFERFERAVSNRSYKGIGLGLWITREIVQAHGGRLLVESQPGQGATFRAVLPLSAAA
jgi:two-component system, OmpR family, sensor kinase